MDRPVGKGNRHDPDLRPIRATRIPKPVGQGKPERKSELVRATCPKCYAIREVKPGEKHECKARIARKEDGRTVWYDCPGVFFIKRPGDPDPPQGSQEREWVLCKVCGVWRPAWLPDDDSWHGPHTRRRKKEASE